MKKMVAVLTEAIYRREKLLSGITLGLCIFLIWSWAFNLQSVAAWKEPLGYQGDAWFAFGIAKAYMEGHIYPFLYKFVPTLNAPFVANWNDYPFTEDFIFAGMGWAGKFIGLFAAANLMLLLAHLLAGMSFWYVCRELKYKPTLAFAGAIVYAFSHYIMTRGLGHLVLSFYWHIPLLLLVLAWVYSKETYPIKHKKYIVSIAVAAICGIFNPYYTGMFLQLLGFAVLLHLVRKQYQKAKIAAVLIGVTIGSFALVNADTIIYGIANGVNALASGRNLAALEVYGLKIPELLLSPGNHPVTSFVEFSHKRYYIPAYVKGEFWSPFMGSVSLAGFFLLLGMGMYRLLQGKLNAIPVHFWFVVWILLYAMIGGFNLVLGAFGFELFRATNRYSIFILTISLLFLIRFLSRNLPQRFIAPLALLIVVVALAEELTGRYNYVPPAINPIAVEVNSDRMFAQTVEREMPNAMVFQLPVAGFPEVGPINRMGDYEHFRPYLFTSTLHYSYGTNKGRGDNLWQSQVASLPPGEMAKKLESYGFGVIMINRKGYVDGGRALIDKLITEGKFVIAENKDLVALKLRPAITPVEIDKAPEFGKGWSADEGTHRWAESSHTEIVITNNNKQPKSYVLSFKLGALQPRVVSISLGGQKLRDVNISATGGEAQFPPTEVLLQPGKNEIRFDTEASPVAAGNGDNRMLAFRVSNIQLTTPENAIQPAFENGWSADEGTHRWSESSHSRIVINNFTGQSLPYVIGFKLAALSPRIVRVSLGHETQRDIDLSVPGKEVQLPLTRIVLKPGMNIISFDTNASPVKAGKGDSRMLSFRISDLYFSSAANAMKPEYGKGWSSDERTHRWAESSRASISIYNFDERARPYVMRFNIAALTPRVVNITVGDEKVGSAKLEQPGAEMVFPPSRMVLKPGMNTILFDSDAAPVSPGNGDSRLLAFRISNLSFTAESE
ncbi:MAG: hypothetical protein ABII63_03880 [Pseudomonadota bacterium]